VVVVVEPGEACREGAVKSSMARATVGVDSPRTDFALAA
jgi:hypothetical protein